MDWPRLAKVQQLFDVSQIEDVTGEVRDQLRQSGISERVRPGMRVAITAGSRGIANIAQIIAAAVTELKAQGAVPFIVPAMGSHGGATPEGQREMLAGYGITEANVGAPIVSSMEVDEIGVTPSGVKVLIDREANQADAILVLNRVKAHTAFKAPNESGLVKMMGIGLGKCYGADTYHRHPLGQTLLEVGRVVVRKAKILGGLAIVENSRDQTWKIAAALPDQIEELDRNLLVEANRLLPRVPFDELDILVVEEMGKNISGTGMDLNVIGMWRRIGGEQKPNYKYIIVLDLTEESHGNALGVGMADLTTKRLVEKIDRKAMYTNVITTNFFQTGKIPVTMETDRDAIEVALKTFDPATVRMVRIKSTLDLEHIWVSESLLPEARRQAQLSVVDDPRPLAFDEAGTLV